MFTGLIEEIGIVSMISKIPAGRTIQISAERITEDLSPDDSVALNGVCLTATQVEAPIFSVTAVEETLNTTTLQTLRKGDLINLERALQVGDRLGGHFVQGHVDGTGRIDSLKKIGSGFEMEITIPDHLMQYIIEKGSICIDGISLTVAAIMKQHIRIAVVPHTVERTTLKHARVGSRVNVEVDMMAKYVEKVLGRKKTGKSHDIDWYTSQGY
jgi:riboflavin synthase